MPRRSAFDRCCGDEVAAVPLLPDQRLGKGHGAACEDAHRDVLLCGERRPLALRSARKDLAGKEQRDAQVVLSRKSRSCRRENNFEQTRKSETAFLLTKVTIVPGVLTAVLTYKDPCTLYTMQDYFLS